MALIPSLTGFVTNPMTEDLDCNGQILNDIATFKTAVLQTNRLDTVSGSPATQIDLDESLRIAATKSVDFTGVGEFERGTGHIRIINLPTTGSSATNLLGYNTVSKEVESTATSAPTDWSTFPATSDADINGREIRNLRDITGTTIGYEFDGSAYIQSVSDTFDVGTSRFAINNPTNEILIRAQSLILDGTIVGTNAPTNGYFLMSDVTGKWVWRDPTTLTLGNAFFTSNITGAVTNALPYQSATDTTAWLPAPTQNNCFLAFNQDVTPNRLEWRLPSATQYRTSKMYPANILENPFATLALGPGIIPSNWSYFECAITHPNGNVYFLPYDPRYITILNPETGVSTTYDGYSNSNNAKFACALTASNMKIYAPPYLGETNWLVYDPYTNTHATYAALYNAYVCVSQVGNFLYALSTDGDTVTRITKFNLITNTETLIASPTGSWWGCCTGTNGKIYYAPYKSSNILVLDPTTDTTTTIATGLGVINSMYKSVCISKTGNLYFAPYNAAQIMKLTPSGVVSFLGAFGGTGSNKFTGITLSTNDVLYLCPYGYNELILWNPNTDTQITTYSANLTGLNALYGTAKWSQLLLLQNATQMCLVPFRVDTGGGGVTVPSTRSIKSGQPMLPSWMLSQNLNKQ